MPDNATGNTMGPLTWEPMPSYWRVVQDSAAMYNRTWMRYQEGSYRFPWDIAADLSFILNLKVIDFVLIFSLAVGFTILRTVLSKAVLTPLGHHLKLTKENISKLPESVWKFLYYTSISSFALYIIIGSGRYKFFQSPSTVWEAQIKGDMRIPSDIYWLYIIQLGFYIHGMYALFFQDAWRKDSLVMGVHHVVTILLVWISLACRHHNIGSLVMLLHDVCDVHLEFAKINVYLKVRNGKIHKVHDMLASVFFLTMMVAWAVSRLYYFPLKVLYASTTVLLRNDYLPNYAMLMNSMLLTISVMNVFWFSQMILLLYKILTGEMKELDDLREYDVAEREERIGKKLD